MLRRALSIGAVCASGLAAQDSVAHDDTILWLVSHVPPLMIADGPSAGQGYGDETLDWFIKRLPQFHHEKVENTPLNRILDIMESGEGVCHPAMLRTPDREAFLRFSKPVHTLLPNELLVRSDLRQKLAPHVRDGRVDVGGVVGDKDLQGVVMAARRYGSPIDEVVASSDGKRLNRVNEAIAVYQQLSAGWADYGFGYAVGLSTFLSDASIRKNSIAVFPIEGLDRLTIARFACSNDEWGETVIMAVDEIIEDAGSQPAWIKYYSSRLDDGTRDRFTSKLKRENPWRRQGNS